MWGKGVCGGKAYKKKKPPGKCRDGEGEAHPAWEKLNRIEQAGMQCKERRDSRITVAVVWWQVR